MSRKFGIYISSNLSWAISFSTVTELPAVRPGFDSWQGHGMDILSLPPRPVRIWSPPSLLPNGYVGLFP